MTKKATKSISLMEVTRGVHRGRTKTMRDKHQVRPYISSYCEGRHYDEPAIIKNVTVQYLMPLKHILPFLAGIAFIVMACLEIAWHS